jgi:hypothetical protein
MLQKASDSSSGYTAAVAVLHAAAIWHSSVSVCVYCY